VKQLFKEALSRISDFAHRNDCGNFGECFDRGIKALTSSPSNAEKGYNIFPENYAAPEYHQLINACQSAWVFGGMGSWNDMGFSDAEVHKQYEELSGVVYETTIWNKVYRMPFIFQPPPHI
jgi:hypothetical protein